MFILTNFFEDFRDFLENLQEIFQDSVTYFEKENVQDVFIFATGLSRSRRYMFTSDVLFLFSNCFRGGRSLRKDIDFSRFPKKSEYRYVFEGSDPHRIVFEKTRKSPRIRAFPTISSNPLRKK